MIFVNILAFEQNHALYLKQWGNVRLLKNCSLFKYTFDLLYISVFFSCYFILILHYISEGNIALLIYHLTALVLVTLQIKTFAFKTYDIINQTRSAAEVISQLIS